MIEGPKIRARAAVYEAKADAEEATRDRILASIVRYGEQRIERLGPPDKMNAHNAGIQQGLAEALTLVREFYR